MSTPRHAQIRRLLTRLGDFSRFGIGIPLRPYQQEVAEAILKSILGRLGLSFVVIFPRQSGKNEVQAHIQAYLLCLLSGQDIEIVSVSPTYKPQALNAMLRLQRCLDANPFTRARWVTQAGFTVRLDRACVHFFSGNSVAQTVGATASALLSLDEAQEIRPSTYDRKFAPMVASTNATRVFWGTPWTSNTLLAREKRRAEFDQEKDGIRRLWTLTAEGVALVHPVYGEFVSGEVGRFGRTHPYIKTQYFGEEIDSSGSMFNPTRLALMQSDEPPMSSPVSSQGGVCEASPRDQPPLAVSALRSAEAVPGQTYAFLLDVAGQDESRMADLSGYTSGSAPGGAGDSFYEAPLDNPARDSASLSIVSIDLSTLSTLQAPTYRIVHRQQWTGANHLTIFGQLTSLVGSWSPQHIVIDATGVGEGLWALLDKAFPTRVIPVKFNRQVKSDLGWKFLSIIDTGRFRDNSGGLTSSEHRPCLPHREASPWDEGQTPSAVGADIIPVGRLVDDTSHRESSAPCLPPREAPPWDDGQTPCGGLASSEHRPCLPHREASPWDEGQTPSAVGADIIPVGRLVDDTSHRESSAPCLPPREAPPWDDGQTPCGGLASSEHRPCLPPEGQTHIHDQVLLQYTACRSDVLPGPGKILRWGVPDGARGPDGQLIHDDFLLADFLVAVLDSLKWYINTNFVAVIEGFDPLSELEGFLPRDHFRF